MQQNATESAASGSRKVLGDTALTAAERIISQIAQFTVFVVAARILGPADFGVFALVSASAILLLRVAEFGWAPFIMSHDGDDRVPRQVLFVAIVTGVLIGLLGIGGAWLSPAFGTTEEFAALMALFSVWVMLATASQAQKGVMIWQQKLKASAICEIAGELVGLVVAIASLFSGWGLLALAFARLSAQTTHLLLSFVFTRLRPLMGMTSDLINELWVFSSQIFVSRMLINIRLYAATFIIGGFLGPAAVGFFRAADRLVSAAGEVIAVPGQLLAWTLIRKARDDGDPVGQADRINAQVSHHIKFLFGASAPIFTWMIVMSPELIGGLLSDEWAPAAPLVAILAVARMLFTFGIVTEPLMSIVGQAKRLPAFTLCVLVMSVALTLISVSFGVYAVAWAQVIIAGLVTMATVWLFKTYAGIQWRGVFMAIRAILLPFGCGVVVLIGLNLALAPLALPDLIEALAFGLAAVVAYALAIRMFDPPFWQQLASGLQRQAS